MSNTGLVSFDIDGFDCGNGYHRDSRKVENVVYCECGSWCHIDDVNAVWKLFQEDVTRIYKSKYKNDDEINKHIKSTLLKTIECTLKQFQNTIIYDGRTDMWK